MRCPIYDHCRARKEGGWCPDENRERLNQLLDERKFNSRDYDFMEAEDGKYCRIVRLLERLAKRYLKEAKVIRPPVSTELIRLFDQQHNIEVRDLPLKAYHGAIWNQTDGWVIQVKASDSPPTMRFTIFHEAFHILAHTKTTPVFRKRGSILGSFNEWLADAFAGCILMPREWVKARWAEVGDLGRMAKIFGVSKSAMCIKLKQLGLI
jgi:predicted transcriptional regulator